MRLHFTKMHGLGNDFIVLDCIHQPFNLSLEQIQHMADRHRGIGFDQMLVIAPPSKPNVDFDYRIFNADGREVEQCGNGARCVGLFLHERSITAKTEIKLATSNSIVTLRIEKDKQITVNMGAPMLTPAEIPFVATKRASSYALEVDKRKIHIGAVSVGNPHAVLQVANVANAEVKELGAKIEHHPRFPERTNVGFMQIAEASLIHLRVYERGTGETLACGSGACAAVVVGRLQHLLAEKVRVKLPGGDLIIQWQGDGYPIWMTGPATFVFEGELL